MKQGLKCQRNLILFLLFITVLAPVIFLSERMANLTSPIGIIAGKEAKEEISSFKHSLDYLKLNAIQQEIGIDLQEPERIIHKDDRVASAVTQEIGIDLKEPEQTVHKDERVSSAVTQVPKYTDFTHSDAPVHGSSSWKENGTIVSRSGLLENQLVAQSSLSIPKIFSGKEHMKPSHQKETNGHLSTNKKGPDKMLREMKDQIVMARAFLSFSPLGANSHLVKELKLRIRDSERAIGEATKDADLRRNYLQKMRAMEATLSKASRVYPSCSSMASKLRAMNANVQEQLRAQRNQIDYLIRLAARTLPKGMHCLSMKLTDDYFSLPPEERQFPNKQKLQQPDLHHIVIFSDNILACAVVVNSTVVSSREPEKLVFHIVTDTLGLPAMTVWFLGNPPGDATIEVRNVDDFAPLSCNHGPIKKPSNFRDPRFASSLNYHRFYLPELFPDLVKVVFLDHDVVVHRDLGELWRLDMKGKVNAAVYMCGNQRHVSPWQLNEFINFSHPSVAENFDSKGCAWAFGMNLFDLQKWRSLNLTDVYHRWLSLGRRRHLWWRTGSWSLGLLTFYNHTLPLEKHWHVLGLGVYEANVDQKKIENAAVIHYEGLLKPWLEIGNAKFKGYWTKFVPYHHPFLQQCNIHQ